MSKRSKWDNRKRQENAGKEDYWLRYRVDPETKAEEARKRIEANRLPNLAKAKIIEHLRMTAPNHAFLDLAVHCIQGSTVEVSDFSFRLEFTLQSTNREAQTIHAFLQAVLTPYCYEYANLVNGHRFRMDITRSELQS